MIFIFFIKINKYKYFVKISIHTKNEKLIDGFKEYKLLTLYIQNKSEWIKIALIILIYSYI